MSGVKNLISGPPKPKKDKDAERRLKEQELNEKRRAESADRALLSSRRSRMSGGPGARSGLGYSGPAAGGGTLG